MQLLKNKCNAFRHLLRASAEVTLKRVVPGMGEEGEKFYSKYRGVF